MLTPNNHRYSFTHHQLFKKAYLRQNYIGKKLEKSIIVLTYFQADTELDVSADRELLRQANMVWELCVALWGEIPALHDDVIPGSYEEQQARRDALSKMAGGCRC